MVKVIVVLVIVVKRVFSLAKTIVVDVIVIYIPRIPVVFFVMGTKFRFMHTITFCKYRNKLLALPRVHLVSSFLLRKNYLMLSLALSVRPSVRPSVCPSVPITKNTTAVFVVYILQIHLLRWFSPTKKPVLLRLQYHEYLYHCHSKSTTAVIVVLHLYHIS